MDFNQIAEAHKDHSHRILENLGLKINLTDMPEHKEYADYYLNRNRLMRYLLRTFKWTKVMELKFNTQSAFLLAVLEKGDGLIEE